MTQPPPRVLPCGDSALLVELSGDIEGATDRVLALDDAVGAANLPGVVECVPGLTTLMVEFDPVAAEAHELADELLRLVSTAAVGPRPGRRVELPVCFAAAFAPDLAAVAEGAAMSAEAVVSLLCSTELRVALIGHLPGLPYLTGLPKALDLPRRASARPSVPCGSVGLAARMACVYPQKAPGGWHVVGRTPARLVDVDAEPPVCLAPGDQVRIVAIDTSRFDELGRLEAEGPELTASVGMNGLRVLAAGVRTLIVDSGRFGVARLGIPRSGAADREALLLANALCGNPPDAAAIEIAVRGPRLVVEAAVCKVALAGDAPLTLDRDGRRARLPAWRSHTLRRGDRLSIGAPHHGLGAVLAVGGGIAFEPRMGSRSTSLRGGVAGLLGRTLQTGDLLPIDPTDSVQVSADLTLEAPGGIQLQPAGRLRVLAGPQSHALGDAGWRVLTSARWHVSPHSDRTGLRLEGPQLALRDGADVPSQGCPAGAIQVTGDGVPTLLGVDRGTTGGYCVPAVVASVDIPRLGRLRPGAEVHFDVVDLATALALLRRRTEELRALATACTVATLSPP